MRSRGNGILLAIEGIDGAGKTTQVDLLANVLRNAGENVVASKEPTDGSWGRRIRESATVGRLSVEDEISILVEDRKEHLEQKISPALDSGSIVILDRYFYSTIAYQGARGVNVDDLTRHMLDFAVEPDIVFLLDIDPALAMLRISRSRGDVPNLFERADYLGEVRQIFNHLADERNNVWKLDGSMGTRTIHVTILRLLVENALKAKRCAKTYGCDEPLYCSVRLAGECRWFDIQQRLVTIDDSFPALLSDPSVASGR